MQLNVVCVLGCGYCGMAQKDTEMYYDDSEIGGAVYTDEVNYNGGRIQSGSDYGSDGRVSKQIDADSDAIAGITIEQ